MPIDTDRMNHSLAVARKMVEIGKEQGLSKEQLKELFILGFNHDIGYEFGGGDNHGINGGNALKNSGYQYWQEIYYHGKPNVEYNSLYLDILNEADMQIDKYGNDVGFDKRLEDILSRYGSESVPYQCCIKLVEDIKRRKDLRKLEDVIADKISKLIKDAFSKVVKPDMKIGKVSDLDEQEIERIKQEYGIEGIILDVDETLRTNMEMIPEQNQQWLESLKGKVKVIILSNGIDGKVEDYFSKKGIDYIGFAHKPFKKNFLKACKKLEIKPENIMVVGDSIIDDVYGGKRNNMKTVLVEGVEEGR